MRGRKWVHNRKATPNESISKLSREQQLTIILDGDRDDDAVPNPEMMCGSQIYGRRQGRTRRICSGKACRPGDDPGASIGGRPSGLADQNIIELAERLHWNQHCRRR